MLLKDKSRTEDKSNKIINPGSSMNSADTTGKVTHDIKDDWHTPPINVWNSSLSSEDEISSSKYNSMFNNIAGDDFAHVKKHGVKFLINQEMRIMKIILQMIWTHEKKVWIILDYNWCLVLSTYLM